MGPPTRWNGQSCLSFQFAADLSRLTLRLFLSLNGFYPLQKHSSLKSRRVSFLPLPYLGPGECSLTESLDQDSVEGVHRVEHETKEIPPRDGCASVLPSSSDRFQSGWDSSVGPQSTTRRFSPDHMFLPPLQFKVWPNEECNCFPLQFWTHGCEICPPARLLMDVYSLPRRGDVSDWFPPSLGRGFSFWRE